MTFLDFGIPLRVDEHTPPSTQAAKIPEYPLHNLSGYLPSSSSPPPLTVLSSPAGNPRPRDPNPASQLPYARLRGDAGSLPG